MGNALIELLAAGPAAIDGGLASELEARGHDLTGTLWSARLLREDPEAIRHVHAEYFRSGARVGISASYQASRQGFAAHGMTPDEADELLARSVRLVREARDEVAAEGVAHPMLVAASVGPYGAIRHDGSEYRGRYGLGHDELVAFHRERLAVLTAADPDLLAIETIPDLDEARALVDALGDLDVPAWISFSCQDDSRTCAGQPIEDAAELVARSGVFTALGVNCSAPEFIPGLVARVRAVDRLLPLVVYPNAGRVWDGVHSEWLGEGHDRLAQSAVAQWFDAGVGLIGGCCGLGPRAIREVAGVAARG
jgi:homocysteine S-methyltransferase